MSAPVLQHAPTQASLGERVSAHMQRFEETDAGGWTVAVDHRDGTAVVVWRYGAMQLTQPGVRGMMLYRWLGSLREAGFTAEPRTDMEVFGKPEEDSGIAWWLHVTGWQAADPRPTPPKPYRPACFEHRVTLRSDDPPVPSVLGTSGRPHSIFFEYWPGGEYPTGYAVNYDGHSERLPDPLAPDWLVRLAEEHRECADAGVWGCER